MLINEKIGKSKSEIVRNQILDFINDKNKHEIIINDKYLLMKHLYKDTVFLYSKDIDSDAVSTIYDKYEYQGFYNFISNKFYDLKYELENLTNEKDTVGIRKLKSQILDGVKEKLAQELKINHQKYFKEPMKLSKRLKNQLEEWEKYRVIELAKRSFFEGNRKKLIDFIFLNFGDEIKEINIDEILSFIQEPDMLLNYYKDEFLKKSIENLYVNFKSYVMYEKYITDLENDKSNMLHKQKIVKDAIEGKKTINVTILKDGHKLTFKTDTREFFRLDNSYSKYNIQAKDRHKYEELFKYSDYLFDEITSITYGKQEIYSK